MPYIEAQDAEYIRDIVISDLVMFGKTPEDLQYGDFRNLIIAKARELGKIKFA